MFRWPRIREGDKRNRINDTLHLNLVVPFNNVIMKAYRPISCSSFSSIELNNNIESNRHSIETSNDILSSDAYKNEHHVDRNDSQEHIHVTTLSLEDPE